jgi:acyl-CoA synthetase (AMP-forming)/AMP-acid ligase II
MVAPTLPSVLHRGRGWPADEVDAIARRWHGRALAALGEGGRLVATVLPHTPEGVATFAALTALRSPVILLVPDARAWRTEPPLPVGTPLLLAPSVAHLGAPAQALGLVPLVLSGPAGARLAGPPVVPLQGPGVVVFTSGSTGPSKPVFRPTAALVAGAEARIRSLALRPGDGVLTGAPLALGQGLNVLLAAIILGGPLGLLDPLDHRDALAALARPEFAYWGATPHFADVLGRCALEGPAVVPRCCVLASPVSRAVSQAFRRRFGVPLRQTYSSSETGIIAADDAPASDVRPETVGRPLPGVEIRIGDHPGAPLPRGEIGRIWVRSPWLMAGYGFPPVVGRPGESDGWWPTRDLGALEADGHLVLAGRLDDCVRTREGRLVNLALVAAALRELDHVSDAAVVPLDGPAGPSLGAVIEGSADFSVDALRARLAGALPAWSRPRVVEVVRALPRLPNGKPDRDACRALLDGGGAR